MPGNLGDIAEEKESSGRLLGDGSESSASVTQGKRDREHRKLNTSNKKEKKYVKIAYWIEEKNVRLGERTRLESGKDYGSEGRHGK